MIETKNEQASSEIVNILKGLSYKNLERLLWFARGLSKNELKTKKQKLTHN